MRISTFAAVSLALAATTRADQLTSFVGGNVGGAGKTMSVSADRISVDRNTEALFATGHVVAVSEPIRLHTQCLERDTNGVCRLGADSSLTTCTNSQDHLHWELRGELEYQSEHHVLLRNVWLRAWGVPIFWIPYLYYPMGSGLGFEIVPGYTSRWGGYIMTKYNYTLCGDPETGADGRWLYADTRLDWRWKNGIAVGEDLNWSLANWGQGKFKIYYAWDLDHDRYGTSSGSGYNNLNWGSTVPYNRYGIQLEHRIDVTERDVVRGRMALFSDTFFRTDFFRTSSFNIKNEMYGYEGNELAWEHAENLWGLGLSVSGPLNEFVGGTSRLPELYFDLAPTPLWKLPVNYETQNRIGYLLRQPAEYGGASLSAFSYNPGKWADYEAFRFDTYHRLTAPFKLWDSLSVVPRIGYHGTFWDKTGDTVVGGASEAGSNRDNTMRSIFEAGVTFAGRGTAWISEDWQHMIEPYADVLAQQAWYAGLGDGHRPYVFDSIDASMDWSDQFAGRSRNLPYSWYGVTPGIRNALRSANERGVLRTVLDIDAYVAMQFNSTTWTDGGDSHRLAEEPGDPNYGEGHFMPVPGARLRWLPFDGAALGGRIEYDSENNKIAQARLSWSHKVRRDFSYHVSYFSRDHRYWDYSSSPVPERSDFDGFNWADFGFAEVGFEHELCDAFAWAPYIRWDCRQNELDEVGAWIDFYRTDCIGFRFTVAYENEYTRIDGSREEEEWRIGLYIYLRALGPKQGLQIGD